MSREPYDPAFLFQRVSPVTLAVFRVLLSAMLAYALWPREVPLGAWVDGRPLAEAAYANVFMSTPYRACIYAALAWFAVGWRPRLAGAVLFCLLLPHVFLAKGRISRHMLIVAVLFTSFLRTTPLWRPADLRDSDPGPMWPVRLMQFQLSALYGVNALTKSTPEYLSGEVLAALSSARSNFLVDLSSGYLSVGSVAVPVWMLAAVTVLVEYWLAVGWWIPRCRRLTAVVGIGFHLFLKAFVIRIFMLDFAAMFFYLTFLLPFPAADGSSQTSKECDV
jgi:hypothetical protein